MEIGCRETTFSFLYRFVQLTRGQVGELTREQVDELTRLQVFVPLDLQSNGYFIVMCNPVSNNVDFKSTKTNQRIANPLEQKVEN